MHEIGKFCSVAVPGQLIFPKKIPGYITPEPQRLEKPNQRFEFMYTPILYNIDYDLDGGKLDNPKKFYIIEGEDYYPPEPVKKGYTFSSWTPKYIPSGSLGDVTFKANWIPNAILLDGKTLNQKFAKLANGRDRIFAIQPAYDEIPNNNHINISSTETPIHASYVNGIIYIYSPANNIYCNPDMSNMCEGFSMLRDVEILSEFICEENTNINSIFKGCSLLTNVYPIENWANGKFADFSDAFSGTPALDAGRIPAWYSWYAKIAYKSSKSGKLLYNEEGNHIPGESIYPRNMNGYKADVESIIIDKPNSEYIFTFTPIEYDIEYNLNGGELINPKKTYTIEDEDYYPPEPVKPDFHFYNWEPECLHTGDYGNITFEATYVN